MRVWIKSNVLLLGLSIITFGVHAQESASPGTYTPYSFYGLGDFARIGSSTSLGMENIGVGLRDRRMIDFQHPAAASIRDSLTFVIDFGGEMRNVYAQSANTSSSFNSANFHHIAIAFPIYGVKWGLNLGITPYTRVGYDIEQREEAPAVIASAGDVRYQYKGEDGLMQGFLNVGYNLLPQLSLGVGIKYYFGTINRYANTIFNSSAVYHSTYSKSSLRVNDFALALGANYVHDLNTDYKMTIGATLSPGSNLTAYETATLEARSIAYSDTAVSHSDKTSLKMPTNLAVGVSFSVPDKWLIGTEFVWNDWSKTEIAGRREMGAAYDIKLGGYYIPNRYDVRYFFNRINYRAGLRYSQTAMLYHDKSVQDKAVSIGLGIPLRGMGDLNFSAEYGQRGTTQHGGIREDYVNFTLSLTLFEIWFMKYRYE